MDLKRFIVSVLFIAGSLHVAGAQNIFSDPRDGQLYEFLMIEEMDWMTENMRYKIDGYALHSDTVCGYFYPVVSINDVCPSGWRLPKEKEVKTLIKMNRKGQILLSEVLQITLCGRMDNGVLAKSGQQNTYWLDEKLEQGHILHWHIFRDRHELHKHDVVNADRKFPVRCVRTRDANK